MVFHDCKKWLDVRENVAYEYLGFGERRTGYCKEGKNTKPFASSQRPQFIWDDCQLTEKKHLQSKAVYENRSHTET